MQKLCDKPTFVYNCLDIFPMRVAAFLLDLGVPFSAPSSISSRCIPEDIPEMTGDGIPSNEKWTIERGNVPSDQNLHFRHFFSGKYSGKKTVHPKFAIPLYHVHVHYFISHSFDPRLRQIRNASPSQRPGWSGLSGG